MVVYVFKGGQLKVTAMLLDPSTWLGGAGGTGRKMREVGMEVIKSPIA